MKNHKHPEAPTVARYSKPNALDDDALYEAALEIVTVGTGKVRDAIWSDWPARSAKPDDNGVVEHPLFKGTSAEWYCLRGGKSSGAQMVANMWHCPHCSQSPKEVTTTGYGHAPFAAGEARNGETV